MSEDILKYKSVHHFFHVSETGMTTMAILVYEVVPACQHMLLIKGSFFDGMNSTQVRHQSTGVI